MSMLCNGNPPLFQGAQKWKHYAAMAATILNRLMHRCAMLEFDGKSYRLKEDAARIAINPEPS